MNENAFSEFRFQTGWKKKEKICFFGKEKEIIVKLSPYFENDGITEEQKKAYIEYKNGEKNVWERLEVLLTNYKKNAESEFNPTTLLIDRNGDAAFLLDDANAPDDGIAVCISPDERIVSQDEYL